METETQTAEVPKDTSVTITLGGKKYKCAEPNPRDAREMLAIILDGQKLAQSGSDADGVRLINLALDMLCLFPSIKADRHRLENVATEAEISDAFVLVAAMVQRRFARSAATVKPE
jgi:hypothetical protein